MAITLHQFADRVRIGEAQKKGSLSIYPIFEVAPKAAQNNDWPDLETLAQPLDYLVLTEAIDSKSFEIGEIDQSGSVNTVVITNMTGKPVLILDGEEILGAKQNRMVNATILVASGKKTAIPVSCVEQGRWSYVSDKFNKSEVFGYSTLRRQKAEQVHFNLRTASSFEADQGAIWEEISSTNRRMGADAPTEALHDVYSGRSRELDEIIEEFKIQPGQVGILAYINNRFACLDLFDQAVTLRKYWIRLLKSYALEALNSSGRPVAAARPAPAELVKAIDISEYLNYNSVGLGTDLRLKGAGIVGAGLAVDGDIVHLSIFPEGPHQENIIINSPQHRRRSL